MKFLLLFLILIKKGLIKNEFTYSNQKMKQILQGTPVSISYGLQKTILFYQNKSFPTPLYGINNHLKNQLIDELNK